MKYNYTLILFLPNTPTPRSPAPRRSKVAGSGTAVFTISVLITVIGPPSGGGSNPIEKPNNSKGVPGAIPNSSKRPVSFMSTPLAQIPPGVNAKLVNNPDSNVVPSAIPREDIPPTIVSQLVDGQKEKLNKAVEPEAPTPVDRKS